jgi:hypothetical protein
MDPFTIAVLLLLGAFIVWMTLRAFRHSRHGPTTVVRGGIETVQYSSAIGELGGEHHMKRDSRRKR